MTAAPDVPVIKQPPALVIFNSQNDALLKQFQLASKNLLNEKHIFCNMKTAVELSTRGKPPLLKISLTDSLSLPGEYVPQVIFNWLSAQLKKPAPKAPVKKTPAKQKGKNIPQQTEVVQKAPEIPPGPYFIYMTDYPKNFDQYQAMRQAGCSVICLINLEAQVPIDADKKSPVAPIDWKSQYASELPIITISVAPQADLEPQIADMISKVSSYYNAFTTYQSDYMSTRFVHIPKFPPDPLPIPQITADRPSSKLSAVSAKGQPNPTPELPMEMNAALTAAYRKAFLSQLDSFISSSSQPSQSTLYQHSAELFNKFPLPAILAKLLLHPVAQRSPEIFTMRQLSYHSKIPYQTIQNVMILKKFEDLVGYPIGDRRHYEQLPLEFLPNILAPLLHRYSTMKYGEYAGKILLAFFHPMIHNLPISEQTEVFQLPLYQGFGKWLRTHELPPPTLEDKPEQTEIATQISAFDVFTGLDEEKVGSSVTNYFDESGLRVISYPIESNSGILQSLSFYETFDQTLFSFSASQRTLPPSSNSGEGGEEEDEEDDNIETLMTIRGSLSRDIDFFFEHNTEKASFNIIEKNARVEFDITNGHVIMSHGEEKRVITINGEVIIFGKNTSIYRTDGSIQQCVDGKWQLIDANGNGFVKIGGRWYKQPELNAPSETVETFFTSRKMTRRADGVNFIEDGDELTITFPNGTQYHNSTSTFSHPGLPDIQFVDDGIKIIGKSYTASFSDDRDCSIELNDNSVSVSFKDDIKNLHIGFGQFKNTSTLVDLVTGVIAHVGARRCVYYLSDNWTWKLGRHICSKKEIIQHFTDGDFVDRIEPVNQMDDDEIQSIISTGHHPRLFIIDKSNGMLQAQEILVASEYQALSELSTTRIAKKTDCDVTLWFDTQPPSYREIYIGTQLDEKLKNQIFDGITKEIEHEKAHEAILSSVGDPKWRELAAQQVEEEQQVIDVLKKFNVTDLSDEDEEEEESMNTQNEEEDAAPSGNEYEEDY